MIGIQVTKASLNETTGNIALTLEETFRRVDSMKMSLDSTTDQALVDLGFTVDDVAVFKTAFADLSLLASIYRGDANEAQPKDFREFARRLWGMGDV